MIKYLVWFYILSVLALSGFMRVSAEDIATETESEFSKQVAPSNG